MHTMTHEKLAEAAEYLKEKFNITRLQTDCIHRAEAMYLSAYGNSFIGNGMLESFGINTVGHCKQYGKDFFTRLIVDGNRMHIDVLENGETAVLESILERCKNSDVNLLSGSRQVGFMEPFLRKGTTLEQILIEKELKAGGVQ